MRRVVYVLWAVGLTTLLANRADPDTLRLQPGSQRALQVQPKAIHKGQRAVLSWCNRDVSEILVEEAAEADGHTPAEWLRPIGKFPSEGSLAVWPSITTTYVVSCADARIACAESITITVH